jgi:putative DeoR family transcriptional regulator (stage III sporulation protein D)
MLKPMTREDGTYHDKVVARVKEVADYVIEHRSTIRATAAAFGVSKSTIHKDLVDRLPTIDNARYSLIAPIIAENLSQRHIRGGIATREHWQTIRECGVKHGTEHPPQTL